MKYSNILYAVLITRKDKTKFFASGVTGILNAYSFHAAKSQCGELKANGIKRCKPVKVNLKIETL